jgi:hypothetical protein
MMAALPGCPMPEPEPECGPAVATADGDHRDEEWTEQLNVQLRAEGWPVRVGRLEGRGICVFAARAIRQGEVLMVDQPVACTVCDVASDAVCAGCLHGPAKTAGGVGGCVLEVTSASEGAQERAEGGLEGCPGCSMVSFCPDCRGARAFHTSSMECKALAALRRQRLPAEVADLSRMLIQLMARQALGHDVFAVLRNACMGRPGGHMASPAQEKALCAAGEAVATARSSWVPSSCCEESWDEDTLLTVMDVQQVIHDSSS